MPAWDDVTAAVGQTLGGDREGGRERLLACWEATTEDDHAQRCVLAHYLADLEPELDDEVAWDQRALAELTHVSDDELAAVGIPSAAGMAPSLHLNLGEGYRRQGRTDEARAQVVAGLAAAHHLADDGYGAMVRTGLDRLAERLGPDAGSR